MERDVIGWEWDDIRFHLLDELRSEAMKKYGTLVFTGKHDRFNISRTVAETLISLSRQYSYGNVNVDEVLFAIEVGTLKMVDKNMLSPGCVLATRKQVVTALNNVVRLSEERANKYIPSGLIKVNSVQYRYQP